MKTTAQRMGHRMYNPKRHICKCQTCRHRCVQHIFSCLYIITVSVCLRKIFYNIQGSLGCQDICYIICAVGYQSFQGMCQGIHTRLCRNPGRHRTSHLRVADCNVRHHFHISDSMLNSCVCVGDHNRTGDFTCCPCSGRNTAEQCFFSQFWKLIRRKECFQCIKLWMLIIHPHCFCGIHSRAASQCNN